MSDYDAIRLINSQRRGRYAAQARRARESYRSATLAAEVRETCETLGAPTPGAFLAHVMSGHDPRAVRLSRIGELVDEIRERGAESVPTQAEWYELSDLISDVLGVYGGPVDLGTSVDAAKTLVRAMAAESTAVAASPRDSTAETPNLSEADRNQFAAWWAERYA